MCTHVLKLQRATNLASSGIFLDRAPSCASRLAPLWWEQLDRLLAPGSNLQFTSDVPFVSATCLYCMPTSSRQTILGGYYSPFVKSLLMQEIFQSILVTVSFPVWGYADLRPHWYRTALCYPILDHVDMARVLSQWCLSFIGMGALQMLRCTASVTSAGSLRCGMVSGKQTFHREINVIG